MRKFAGSALVDYLLPTVIVGLVLGLGLYGFTNENYLKKFLKASGNMDDTLKKEELSMGNTVKGGSLGGTPSAPVVKCNFGGTCDIDYGEYILKGVPSDFGGFVEANGTSGGLDKLAATIKQIAQGLKEKDPTSDGYKEYERLANLIHMQGEIFRVIETKAKNDGNFATKVDYTTYMNNQVSSLYTPPAEIAGALPGLDTSITFADFVKFDQTLGDARHTKVINGNTFGGTENTNLSHAIIDQYDQIIADGRFSDSLKALTQELFLNLNDLSAQALYNSEGVGLKFDGYTDYSWSPYDPVDGTPLAMQTEPCDDLTSFLNPQFSLNGDINGALTCTAGKNITTGRACH